MSFISVQSMIQTGGGGKADIMWYVVLLNFTLSALIRALFLRYSESFNVSVFVTLIQCDCGLQRHA